jgi:hypothetical protein
VGRIETATRDPLLAFEPRRAQAGELLCFYGMLGQEYGKTIPLYSSADVARALPIARKVNAV